MANGLNKVMLMGRLGQDPETNYTNGGICVSKISLATSESWVDGNGQRQERTEWHRVVFFNRLAEVVGEYLVKGGMVFVEGKLRTNKWQDQDGNDRYTTEILGDSMTMIPTGNNQQQNNNLQNNNRQQGNRGNRNRQQTGRQGNRGGRNQNRGNNQGMGDGQAGSQPPMDQMFEDDIPFLY